ncbi:MAG: hypothetical protein ACTSUR_05745 [Candidatus Heimdallarchaeaceae archaeon]
MTSTEKKKDGFFGNLFDAYKQAVILLLMAIVYNIIPAGIAFLGFWLAYPDLDYTPFITDIQSIIADPLASLSMIHYGYYIMGVAVILAIISFAAAFLFTASRNDRIAKPLNFIKAFFGAWGILFQFALLIIIVAGAYYGLTYVGVHLLDLIMIIVTAVVAGISFLAMIFRVIDYLLELE